MARGELDPGRSVGSDRLPELRFLDALIGLVEDPEARSRLIATGLGRTSDGSPEALAVERDLIELLGWAARRMRAAAQGVSGESVAPRSVLVLLPRHSLMAHVLRRAVPFAALGIPVACTAPSEVRDEAARIVRLVANALHLRPDLTWSRWDSPTSYARTSPGSLVVFTGRRRVVAGLAARPGVDLLGATGRCSVVMGTNAEEVDTLLAATCSVHSAASCSRPRVGLVVDAAFTTAELRASRVSVPLPETLERLHPSVLFVPDSDRATAPAFVHGYRVLACGPSGESETSVGMARDPGSAGPATIWSEAPWRHAVARRRQGAPTGRCRRSPGTAPHSLWRRSAVLSSAFRMATVRMSSVTGDQSMRAFRRRGVAALIALAILVALDITPVSALTLQRSWSAKIGPSGANGGITLKAYTSGIGSISYSLKGLKPLARYIVQIRTGTCATPGTVKVRLTNVHTSDTGTVSRVDTLYHSWMSGLWAAAHQSTFILRIVSGTSVRCGAFTFARATRVAVPSLGIDLPVVRGPSGYPLCRVAMYYVTASQPREPGKTFIYAHARRGMFLPLLTRFKSSGSAGLLGRTVMVWTSDNSVSYYRITRALKTTNSMGGVFSLSSERLRLQTSTGPNYRYPKLIVDAVRYSTVSASHAASHPKPHPIKC